MSGVQPFGLVWFGLAPPRDSSIFTSPRSPFMAAQLRGVRPLWSPVSTSNDSGRCPAIEDSIRTDAISV